MSEEKFCLLASFFVLLIGAQAIRAQASAPQIVKAKQTVFLHSGWRFREAGKEEWHPASVPGVVHTDLLANKLIPDPFYRDNESKLQWIGLTDWEYQTSFAVDSQLLQRENVELTFNGLDTYASVLLNGKVILRADNMFREWRVDVKNQLRVGDNILEVRFRSPINEVLPQIEKQEYFLPTTNDNVLRSEKNMPTSPFTRKAPYQYGWDWGPRFVTSGIWKPVSLEAWDAVKLTDVYVRQKEITSRTANLSVEIDVVASKPVAATFVVGATKGRAKDSTVTRQIQLQAGANHIALGITINNPELWYPNGYGAQPLYDVRTSVLFDGKKIDESATRIGLRTIELRRAPDRLGKSFEFVVNGIPVYAKGANWIPADSFTTRVTPAHYRQLIESARAANMNMLRVWGGGIYESKEFYDLCDEMGIMVWQDFMFACAMYPGDAAFVDNVRQEAVYQVKRLRNHPSLALWCGNNELEIAWNKWPFWQTWKRNHSPAIVEKVWKDYLKLFTGVLPEVVAQLSAPTPYWSSSPSANFEETVNSQMNGDVHYWAIGKGAFPDYESVIPRFMSEFGMQSFPDSRTVEAFTLPADRDLTSPIIGLHQKHPRGNKIITDQLFRLYPETKDFDSFLYVSQIWQAEGIKLAVEHLRRNRPRNMGALYWQLDDCWGVTSWSSIDYYGRWKALHYYARRFFNDLLISPHTEDGAIGVYIISDRTHPIAATLRVRLMDFDGNILREEKTNTEIAPLTSKSYLKLLIAELMRDHDPAQVFLNCEVLLNNQLVSTNNYFFASFKELLLPTPQISAVVSQTPRGYKVSVRSNKVARSVHLSLGREDGFFSDNYFDLLPNEARDIELKSRATLSEVRQNLKVQSLVDAFHIEERNQISLH